MSRLQTYQSWLRPLWMVPADLVAVLALVVLTDIVVFLPVLDESPVRAVLGLAFVLFVPGYALVAALFPEAGRPNTESVSDGSRTAVYRFLELVPDWGAEGITMAERVALAFGLSLALVPLLLVALTFSPFEFALIPIFLAISGVTVVCAGVAAKRRRGVPEDRRFRVPYRAWIVAGKQSVPDADSPLEAVLNVSLAVAILLAVSSLTYAVVAPPDGERHTGFYVLTESDDGELVAGSYPESLSTDQPSVVTVGIENHEQETVEYSVVVQLQQLDGDGDASVITERSEVDRFSVTLGDNETSIREQVITLTDGATGEPDRLVFLLYVGDVPETPTRDNAYRSLQLWVDGEGRP